MKIKVKETIIVLILLLISGLAHGINMFRFPYYENDEGVYLSQTWSLLKFGQLAPYTYWYDHAPAGWIFMAPWVKLTGGFFTFGPSINTGRVFMLLLHLASVVLVLYISFRLSGNWFPGILAVIIFSLSPLAIYFQRRVLLDNIMIFWVLVSFALILNPHHRLSSTLMSAVAFGIAVLTKENAIYLLPAFIYLINTRPFITSKTFNLVQWLTASSMIISIYFLYALLRGELFPTGFLGDHQQHVSLLTSLYHQFTRGPNLPFWNPQSDFYISLGEWLSKDPFTVALGAAGTIVSLIVSLEVKELRVPALFALLFWVFLMRGNLTINFYVIPAIPLIAINFALLLNYFFRKIHPALRPIFQSLAIALVIVGIFYSAPLNPYVRDETKAQIEAVNWIKQNLPSETFIVIDNYAFIDLHESRFPGDKVFPNADWFWKLDYDPAIRDYKYGGDWHKIEYIALSHEMVRQMRLGTQKILLTAYENSHPIMEWNEDSIAYVDLSKFISTNGDWISIFKMNDKREVVLKQSWNYFKNNFIRDYGQVIDPTANGNTTSEGQAYTMMRAVWENDFATFRNVWQWTKDHMQHRQQDKLLSWLWVKEGENYVMGDSASAADADEDIALALLFASKKWKNDTYRKEAEALISDIWTNEVKEINGHYYLISGSDKGKRDGVLINPSYISPAWYRIFAEVDRKHPWKKLIDDSYSFLNILGNQPGNSIYLPKNWVFMDYNGNLSSAERYVEKEPNVYGFDAFRITWRVAVDALWFNEKRAVSYLKTVEPFYRQKWQTKGSFAALYNLNGTEAANYSSLSTDAGALSVFTITNKKLAEEVYQKLFENKFNFKDGYWGEKAQDYYSQSWGWFATALHMRNLPNLYSPSLFSQQW